MHPPVDTNVNNACSVKFLLNTTCLYSPFAAGEVSTDGEPPAPQDGLLHADSNGVHFVVRVCAVCVRMHVRVDMCTVYICACMCVHACAVCATCVLCT